MWCSEPLLKYFSPAMPTSAFHTHIAISQITPKPPTSWSPRSPRRSPSRLTWWPCHRTLLRPARRPKPRMLWRRRAWNRLARRWCGAWSASRGERSRRLLGTRSVLKGERFFLLEFTISTEYPHLMFLIARAIGHEQRLISLIIYRTEVRQESHIN